MFELLSVCVFHPHYHVQPGTRVGSLSVAHLHITVADSSGRVLGGHLCAGSLVRTTAELVIARRVSSRSGGRCWLA